MTEEGNLATSKFMYPTELAYSHSRIHDPFKYRHFHDEDELLKLLNKYLKTNRKIESKCITILESYSYLEKYEDSLSFCRNRLKDIRFLIEIIGFNLTRYFQADEISDDDTISRKMSTLQSGNTEEHQTNCSSEEEKFDYNTFYETWNEEFKDGILDTEEKLEIIKSDFYYLDTDLLRQYLEGSVLVNVSAVTTVLLAIDKIFDQLNTQIAIFEEKDTREQLKCVFSYILKFSSLFDFLYGAMKVTLYFKCPYLSNNILIFSK